jgi:hypothetical protein
MNIDRNITHLQVGGGEGPFEARWSHRTSGAGPFDHLRNKRPVKPPRSSHSLSSCLPGEREKADEDSARNSSLVSSIELALL